jgi:SAM-dependent methyltransferase
MTGHQAPDLGGYMSAVSYPAYFAAQLAPAAIAGVLGLDGEAGPAAAGAFRLLDIGCGPGIGAALIAAAHPEAMVEGIDGLPAHVAQGRAFAAQCGVGNLSLTCARFDEVVGSGAADCDFVTAHGVIAWVAPAAREAVFDIAARRLAPGGILAVSYNALPGWADRLAMQRLLWAYGDDPDPMAGFARAFDRVSALAAAGIPALPGARIAEIAAWRAEQVTSYYAHEYLNANWTPLWHADVRRALADRGLAYRGQTVMALRREDLTLRRAHRELLVGEDDPVRRETVVDVLRNTQFRIDLYQRPGGGRSVPPVWVAADAPADAPLECAGPAGRLRYDNPAARAIIGALQDGPRERAELAGLGFGRADIANALDCLLIGGQALLCAPPTGAGAVARAVNRELAAQGLMAARAGVHGPVAMPALDAPGRARVGLAGLE